MLTVEEALAAVMEQARPLPPRRIPLVDALGCRIAESVSADLDLPPFDKALMDGFAVCSDHCQGPGPHRLVIGEEILAGWTATRPLAPGEAAVIMTGAPLPSGADAVVRHEKTEDPGDGTVLIRGEVRSGQARLVQGRELRAGDVLFRPGDLLNAAALGVLASAGREEIRVIPRPRVVIVPTGDELVAPRERPGRGQIRETNSVVLAALVQACGGQAVARPIAPDDPRTLRRALSDALEPRPDVLIVCGGVSAGKKDLVPDALTSLGVQILFHKVRLKPGKPLLFGVGPLRPNSDEPSAMLGGDLTPEAPTPLVFGLPGNPVSGVVGFLLLIAPAFARLRGEPRHLVNALEIGGTLAQPFQHRGDRPTYHPGRLLGGGPDPEFEPLAWAGSADLRTVSLAHGFIRFPEGDRDFQAGEPVRFLRLP